MDITKTTLKDSDGNIYELVSKPIKIHTRKHIDSLNEAITKLHKIIKNKDKQIELMVESMQINYKILEKPLTMTNKEIIQYFEDKTKE